MKGYVLTSVLIISALTGCGNNGISASNEDVLITETASVGVVQRVKDYFKSSSKTISIEMPLSVLIGEATREWLDEKEVSMYALPPDEVDTCLYSPGVIKHFKFTGEEAKEAHEIYISNIVPAVRKEYEVNSKKADFVDTVSAEERAKLIKLWKAIEAIDNNEYTCLRLFISTVNTPVSGWEINNQLEQAYTLFISSLITNDLYTLVVSEVGGKAVWKTDTQLKKEINEILDRAVRSGHYLEIVKAAIDKATSGKYLVDNSGKNASSVHFSINNYDVQGSEKGVTLIKSGVQWFGNGIISSKNYTTNISNVESVVMKKTKTIETSESNSQSQKDSNSVKVGS